MNTGIQKGCLFIADISGYTAFITQTELEHSREILDNLLKTLVDQFQQPLVISRLEGDAVFAYVPSGGLLLAQTLLELIENIYSAFRSSRDNIRRACHCGACTQSATLGLKFVAHNGEFSSQVIGGIAELQGADVIAVHRLLKNHVIEKTSIDTYAFISEAAANALSFGDLTGGMTPHVESYEHLGEIGGYVLDVEAMWLHNRERRRVYIAPEEAWAQAEFDLPASPAVAWEYLNNPQCICEWCGLSDVTLTDLKWGRLGVGSGRYCVHAAGKAVTVDTILDYQPFDYVTVETRPPSQIVLTTTTELRPTGDHTRVIWRVAKPGGPRVKALARQSFMVAMRGQIVKDIEETGAKLRQMIEADQAQKTHPKNVMRC